MKRLAHASLFICIEMCYYCKSCVLMLEKTKLNQETTGRQQQQSPYREYVNGHQYNS
jgi:hypothetical protein